MPGRPFDAKPPVPNLIKSHLDHKNQTSVKFESKPHTSASKICIWNVVRKNGSNLVRVVICWHCLILSRIDVGDLYHNSYKKWPVTCPKENNFLNKLRTEQHGRHFADDMSMFFSGFFMKECGISHFTDACSCVSSLDHSEWITADVKVIGEISCVAVPLTSQ